jgi:hypothetical protein
MKMDKASDGKGGQGGFPKPPVPESAQPAAAQPAAPAAEDGFDDLGYPIDKPAPEKPEAPAPVASETPEAPEKPEKPETPATGYGDEPPKAPEPAPKAPEPKAEIHLDYELDAKGLPQAEADKLKLFLKKHGAPKELAQALADEKKAELAQAEAARAQAEANALAEVQATRAAWHKELKDDPTFGGEKFAHNVLRAEKVMQDFMVHTKKILTERKGMLPPYVMRDLAHIADRLYATEKLVQGDPAKPGQEGAKDEDDPLAFYN